MKQFTRTREKNKQTWAFNWIELFYRTNSQKISINSLEWSTWPGGGKKKQHNKQTNKSHKHTHMHTHKIKKKISSKANKEQEKNWNWSNLAAQLSAGALREHLKSFPKRHSNTALMCTSNF